MARDLIVTLLWAMSSRDRPQNGLNLTYILITLGQLLTSVLRDNHPLPQSQERPFYNLQLYTWEISVNLRFAELKLLEIANPATVA